MNSTSKEHQCLLPLLVNQVINISSTVCSLAMPRELMKGYLDCQGFAHLLLNADWDEQVKEYPFLIAIFAISLLLTLLGIIWFIYEFTHVKSYRAETAIERSARLVISITLLISLVPYTFFLWLAFTSYLSVKSSNEDKKDTSSERLRLSGSFETYHRSLQIPLNESGVEIRKMVGNLTKDLALQLESAAPKIIQKGERSLIAKITLKSADLIPILQSMQEELQELMANIMQLSDHARFFYRNTTTLLELEQITDQMYFELLFKEFEATRQKIIMLLNIENVVQKIREITDFSSTMNNLRQNLTNLMYTELDMLQRHLNETVTRKSHDSRILNKNLSEMWMRAQYRNSSKADFYVRPVINHLELAYCIMSLIPLALVVMYLERFIRSSSNRAFTRYVLMSIISIISSILICCCIFVIAHFLHGAIYYNYRREIEENANFCALPFCSFHTDPFSLLQRHLQSNATLSVENYGKETLQHLCGSILAYSNSSHHNLWLQELNEQSQLFEEIFRSGAMFEVIKQELYLENWYELHNILSTHASSKRSARELDLLKCNLNSIKSYIFEQVFKHGIVVSLLKLTQQSALLRSHLPSGNLTRLIKRVLREAQDLQDFCSVLRNLIEEKTEHFLELLAREFVTFRDVPQYDGTKFDNLGISHETYVCIENSLHAFSIAAFGILILLFVIFSICVCLVMLYEKSGALGAVRVSSLSRVLSHTNNSAGMSNRSSRASKVARSATVKKPTQVRFKDPPTVSGNPRFRRHYPSLPNSNNRTKLAKQIQAKKRIADPLRQKVAGRRRRRKFGLHKCLRRKFTGLTIKR